MTISKLYELEALGFMYGTTCWFQSYLTARKQMTVVEGRSSDLRQINCGLPSWGPYRYINDLQQHCVFTTWFIYADDMALLCTGICPDEVHGKLQSDLNHPCNWFIKLSVNTSKTKVMLLNLLAIALRIRTTILI